MERAELIERVEKLNVWKRRGERAPHKPLLLLYALAHAAHGDRDIQYAQVDQVVGQLLREFGPQRQIYHPEFPFWHLQSDRLWEVQDADQLPRRTGSSNPTRSTLLEAEAVGRLPIEVFELVRSDPDLLSEVAQTVLAGHFTESLHEDILDAVGLELERRGVPKRKRDPQFRERVLRAYEHRCAICGFQAQLGNVDIGLEAAHIRWHQAGGPDEEPNGLALCVMHHKLFDRGAMTVAEEDLSVRVSQHVHGGRGFEEWVTGFHGRPIEPPQHPDYRPEPGHLAWHWREVFRQPARYGPET